MRASTPASAMGLRGWGHQQLPRLRAALVSFKTRKNQLEEGALEHLHPLCQAWTPPTPPAPSQSAAPTAHAATRRCSSSRKSQPSSSGATRRRLPTAPARLCGEYPQPPAQPSSLAPLSLLTHLPYQLFCLRGSPKTSYLPRVPMGGGALPWLFTCTSLLTALSLIAPKAPVSAFGQKKGKEARGFSGC